MNNCLYAILDDCPAEEESLIVRFMSHDLYRGLSAQNELIRRGQHLTAVERQIGLQTIEDCQHEANAHDDLLIPVVGDFKCSDYSRLTVDLRQLDEQLVCQFHPATWRRVALLTSDVIRVASPLPYVRKGQPHRRCHFIDNTNLPKM